MTQPKTPPPVPVDPSFVKHLQVGSRLFHYPSKGSPEKSFTESPSAEYTLYSVIDLPTEDDVVMVKAFDEKEERHNFSKKDLLSGDWWHNQASSHP